MEEAAAGESAKEGREVEKRREEQGVEREGRRREVRRAVRVKYSILWFEIEVQNWS